MLMWVQLAFGFEAASLRGHVFYDLLQIQLLLIFYLTVITP